MCYVHVKLGRGGGLVVSILALCSNDPSSNPLGYLYFLCDKAKTNEKEARVGPSFYVHIKSPALEKTLNRDKTKYTKPKFMVTEPHVVATLRSSACQSGASHLLTCGIELWKTHFSEIF